MMALSSMSFCRCDSDGRVWCILSAYRKVHDPLASQSVIDGEEEGGQRAQGSHPAQAVPAFSIRDVDAGFDGIQPCGLFPVFAHPLAEGRRALGDAGFTAPDEQEVGDAGLGVGRQGQELCVEKARLEGFWDGTLPAHEILDAGLHSAAVHQPTTLVERLCGVVDLLSCGRHHDPLSSYRRTWSKGVGPHVRSMERGAANVPQHTRDGLRVIEYGERSRSGRARRWQRHQRCHQGQRWCTRAMNFCTA